MATQNNSAFYLEALKAIKLQGEQAPAGSDARKLYSTKADSLRNILKTQFGMMNIDADYGAGIALKDTPGGGNIDWNVLSNAADILGTSQAGSTRSAFDRALGEYLTRNLPVWQKASASPSAAITATSTPTMGGASAAQSIIAGKPVQMGGPPSVASATPIPQGANLNQPPTDTVGTPVPIIPTGQGAGMGTGANVYGDFIKSQYFANNDYEGYFISKTPNIPTIKDPTTGKVTIDWANPSMPANMYTLYGQGVGFWNTAQGLSKEQNTFNATEIEKNPAFIEQGKVFTAEMELLLKQNGLAVDAQLAGLKGSIEANKAGLEYELNTIKREVAASNWRSRQSLAASGMAFSGMLGYLYGQNEGKAMDNTIRATAVSAAEIKAMGEQMAILEGSKLSYASDLEGLYGAKRAAYRASILDPQNARYTEVGQLLDTAIAGLEGTTAMATPSLAMGQRADVSAAATAASEDAKWWLTMTVNALDKGISIVKNADGSVSLTQVLSQKDRNDLITAGWPVDANGNITGGRVPTTDDIAKWLENGIIYDSKTGTLTHKMTPSEAETNRHNIEMEAIQKRGGDTAAAIAAETKRHNGVMEAQGAAGGGGTTNPDGTPVYDQKPDLSVLSNSGASPANLGLANTHLMAGTGAVSADTITEFMKGTTFYWIVDPTTKKGSWSPYPPADTTGVQTSVIPGFSSLSQTEMENTLELIDDPIMAAVAYALYTGQASEPAFKRWQASQKEIGVEFTDAQIQSALAICNKYFGQ